MSRKTVNRLVILLVVAELIWATSGTTSSVQLWGIWAVFIVSLLGLFILVRKDLRVIRAKFRATSGRCQTCGYDLRATPNRCPECGATALKLLQSPAR